MPRPGVAWGTTLLHHERVTPTLVAPALLDLAERLMTHVRAGTVDLYPGSTTLPSDRYGSRERLEREQQTLFRRFPIAIAAASELATPGTCLRHDALGLPLLLVADEAGSRAASERLSAPRHAARRRRHPVGRRRSCARTTAGPTASTARSATCRIPRLSPIS
jgi:hypothetical protein